MAWISPSTLVRFLNRKYLRQVLYVCSSVMKILSLVLSLSLSTFCTILDSSRTAFWLTSKLENIEWRKGCLTTAGCAQPRFQLVLINGITNEKLSKSWLITPNLVQERQRFYVTHWSDGNPSDIQILCEVVGVDPTYGFPRICDSSTSVGIYQNQEKKSLQKRSGTILLSNDGKVIISLSARCFNSTIVMEKHEERCPWCVEYSDDTIINQQYPEDLKSGFMQFIGNESHVNILLIAFALTTALSSALCAFMLYLYLRQKKSRNLSPRKCQPYGAARIMHTESPNDSAESTRQVISLDFTSLLSLNTFLRYDIPWDRKYRPLPKWTSSRSSSSGASPPDTSSTFTTSSQHLKPSKIVVGNILHQIDSQNSSIYERPGDAATRTSETPSDTLNGNTQRLLHFREHVSFVRENKR
uniref:C2 domain-containing protein n=1 Tax=Setaria digitata TaxID=48799 RepID=A0A915PRJ7_9BILA